MFCSWFGQGNCICVTSEFAATTPEEHIQKVTILTLTAKIFFDAVKEGPFRRVADTIYRAVCGKTCGAVRVVLVRSTRENNVIYYSCNIASSLFVLYFLFCAVYEDG